MKTVGQIIRHRRESLGLTLQALADEVQAAKSYLSMIENHRVPNPPSRDLLERLEQALQIHDGELRRAADWEITPAPVRHMLQDLLDKARSGEDLARTLKSVTGKGKDGWRNLDKAYRSGELGKLIDRTLDHPHAPKNNLDPRVPVRFRIPVINKVAAGYPRDFTDLDYPARVADDYIDFPGIDDPQAFAARVVGDSMQPDYCENDIVVFSPAAPVVSGCDCFVRILPDHVTTFKRVFFDPAPPKSPTLIRLQPLNPKFAPQVLDRELIAGLYKAVCRYQRL